MIRPDSNPRPLSKARAMIDALTNSATTAVFFFFIHLSVFYIPRYCFILLTHFPTVNFFFSVAPKKKEKEGQEGILLP